ncbi:hypothetical protein TKK_0008993 [Trichogramma kaykai]|uniref:DNA replication complex GINS protein PSF3 n=1 Tax=Trichogramma kaykai TaxID=54128 RepID=A0ABD2X2Z2_9HYME
MSLIQPNQYFSIKDILVTEERVSSEVRQPMPNLGFLCSSSKKEHLDPGSKLDIPVWLASSLSSKHKSIVSCELPRFYKDSYKEILHADACAVELNKWNQYFYELGLILPPIVKDDNQQIPELLLEVFKSRFRLIMDCEQSVFGAHSIQVQLTALEKQLLKQGNQGKMLLINWLNKGVKHIQTSDVVDNLRKRKRMEV